MNRLVIIGASGHGKVIADIAVLNGYSDISFLDDDVNKKTCGAYPVNGTAKDAPCGEENTDMILAIGNAADRRRIQEALEARGANIVTLAHPASTVARDAVIGAGSLIAAGAVINPGARIGKGVIVNTCASVDHDCVVGDYSHVAVGARLCGTVTVGAQTWTGAGAVVSNNLTVCDHAVIGAGAVVVRDITQPGTYTGVPAKKR